MKGDAILPTDLPAELTAHRTPVAAPAAGLAAGGSAGSAPAAGGPLFSEEGVPALARALFQHARSDPRLRVLPAVERELVIQALQETHGNQLQAAKILGITRSTLRKRILKFGIKQDLSIG